MDSEKSNDIIEEASLLETELLLIDSSNLLVTKLSDFSKKQLRIFTVYSTNKYNFANCNYYCFFILYQY